MTQFQNLIGFWRLWSGFCPLLWARSGKPLGFLSIAPILKDGSPQLLASPLCCLPQLLGQQSTQAETIGTLELLRGTCVVDDFHPTWGSPLGELQSPWRISSKWDLEIPCLSHSLQRQLWAVKRRKDWELVPVQLQTWLWGFGKPLALWGAQFPHLGNAVLTVLFLRPFSG